MIADIIPESRTYSDIESFSYEIPKELEDFIFVGSLVKIPFGNRTLRGVVRQIQDSSLEVQNKTVQKYQIKSIQSIDDSFILPKSYIEIAQWISNYYLCSLGEAIALFLPPEMKRPKKNSDQPMDMKNKRDEIELNEEQKTVFNKIKTGISQISINGQKCVKPFLLHGITGSGKTEIYIKAAQEVIKLGRKVVVLVPEIILTPQTVQRFEEIFAGQVALMHSHLSKSEKYNCYYDFYSGKKPIIVGPRSALLVPNEKIGLIIIDEEQEDSFKQEQKPRYHAVTLAEKIAENNNALLILGTATPRTESFYKAKTGNYQLLELKNRHNTNSLPASTLIDLRNEIKLGNFSPLSELLQGKIGEILKRKKQILLFLNRRGTATFVSCRDCGFICLCPNCSIPLVYYVSQKNDYLTCHHCDHREVVPLVCPDCSSHKIKFFGIGIDKIVSEVEKLFPLARISKVDSTTITSKKDYDEFYQKFKNHEVDIVIGTQMIAKGFDIPNVDLVGIISADTGLNMPHYKANEKTFQILTQVSGRSGRATNRGETILQTYWPDALPIQSALNHDVSQFYNHEIVERQKLNYPPFCKIIRIVSEHIDQKKASIEIDKLATTLRKNNINIIGPGACFYQRLHGRYRFHLMIKCDSIDEKIIEIWKNFPNLFWDVDPVNLL